MEQSILVAMLSFVGMVAAENITWELIKRAGRPVIESFKGLFCGNGRFETETEAERFLEEIASRPSYDPDEPLRDAGLMYKRCAGVPAPAGFNDEFMGWLRSAGPEIIKLAGSVNNSGGFVIGGQIAKDHGQINNIVTQNNYR